MPPQQQIPQTTPTTIPIMAPVESPLLGVLHLKVPPSTLTLVYPDEQVHSVTVEDPVPIVFEFVGHAVHVGEPVDPAYVPIGQDEQVVCPVKDW